MKKILAEILAPRLRAARKAKALTSIVCAKAVGVSQPAWNMWEMGVRLPKIELLTEICDLLQVTPNDLLGYSEDKLSEASDNLRGNAPTIQNSSVGVVVNGANTGTITVSAHKRRKAPSAKRGKSPPPPSFG